MSYKHIRHPYLWSRICDNNDSWIAILWLLINYEPSLYRTTTIPEPPVPPEYGSVRLPPPPPPVLAVPFILADGPALPPPPFPPEPVSYTHLTLPTNA